ncbi:CD99 antigen isoform X1 [Myotis daubentonii]|uniref:CD99 antigen isoform X1 n=1 Tax=Myotis daubentonii TaxID=98922 RepID=UPI00287332DF|nr:CD99 antigen isoform X1 [Myotis daubentonii]
MARWAVLALLLIGLRDARVSGQGDFDLADAFDDGPKKPTPTPRKPSSGDDLSLEDALGGGGHSDPGIPAPPRPKPNPNPKQPETSGGFSDSDLLDGTSGGAGAGGAGGGGDGAGGGGGSPRHEGDGQGEPQGVIPGIIGAVVVAVAGAISSFIAYQKKKLCFKGNAEQGDINLENHRSINAEPPVQQTLLAK